MPSREKYVPKHRTAPTERTSAERTTAPAAPAVRGGARKAARPSAGATAGRALRTTVTYSGVAVAATGLAVVGGVLVKDEAPATSAASLMDADHAPRQDVLVDAAPAADRARQASRSDLRSSLEKEQALDQQSGGQVTRTESLASADPRDVALRLMPEYGLSASEFGCLDSLWISESDWDHTADNPTSSAYGIPQALTGGTHDNLPADYMTNPVSQIRWGLEYIRDSYGSACSAWSFKQANNWY